MLDYLVEEVVSSAYLPEDLRYKPGQHFGAHTDYYEPEDFQEQPEVQQMDSVGHHHRCLWIELWIFFSTKSRN